MSNIRWIWWVTGLMIIALAGIVWMQVNWIKETIRVVEDQFDTEIFSALNSVRQEIERDVYDFNLESQEDGDVLGPLRSTDSATTRWSDLFTSSELDEIQNSQIDLDKLRDLVQSAVINKLGVRDWKGQRITDLINLEKLDNSIHQNLRSRGIKTDYHYGILSNEDGNFVIMDGSFVVFPEQEVEATITKYNLKLKNSPYATNLFMHNNTALGKLIIEFPTRSRIILGRIMTNIILSVLFIAITLFSFLYTVLTILRQKKIAEMKTDFINNMTHEFKTPIATISLAVDSIQSPNIKADPEKVGRFAHIIREENKRMLVQVEKVLQMAQFNNKRLKLSVEYVDVHRLLTQAKEHIELQVKRRGGEVTIDLGATTHIIKGDENHLSNIFHNLLDNANKYSPEEPRIEIRTKDGNGGIIIEIEDHGQGMSREQIKNIFEKFYRIHTGNVHDIKGFGLGLSYVKAMVDAHQGQIHVSSKIGKGSTFQLFFPYPSEK